MIGECFINGKDAYSTWGLTLGDTSLTAMMTPSPVKGYIRNKSPYENGAQVLCDAGHGPKVDERDIQITFAIQAVDMTDFLEKYSAFVAELEQGRLDISTKYQPGVVYHFMYHSCQQFSQFNGRLGKFVLKLNEPNPKNRK